MDYAYSEVLRRGFLIDLFIVMYQYTVYYAPALTLFHTHFPRKRWNFNDSSRFINYSDNRDYGNSLFQQFYSSSRLLF